MRNFDKLFVSNINKIIEKKVKENPNRIFVIIGDTSSLENNINNIVDKETFAVHGTQDLFTSKWATNIFIQLNANQDSHHVLSYPQFAYLLTYFDESIFSNKVFFLRDNLRQLFPINKSEYIEKTDIDNTESRPDELPIYMAEQLVDNGNYYYVLKLSETNSKTIKIFQEQEEPINAEDKDLEVIDLFSNNYALDYFINESISEDNFSKKVVVSNYSKIPISPVVKEALSEVNALLSLFGGSIAIKERTVIKSSYTPKEESVNLLKKYWGDSAEFRNLTVYQNPDTSNQVVEISQGKIVDLIIKEYEKAKKGAIPRDLFLTAPTGAGKSLLFQLPSFYVSNCGDVTIVVSPLIALMKDQIEAIYNDRRFYKAALLNSDISLIDRERILESTKEGEIDVLYLSPELLLSYDIKHFIGERKIGLMVIDEAHLITTWGRDFRVDYWFLGNHIHKIRKYNNMNFPVVAVTATAIYGGTQDMVHSSTQSLHMNDPHLFIGQVKRDDITFAINNYQAPKKQYEKEKIKQTADFIQNANELGLKTLVYTPYARHIDDIIHSLENKDIAVGYSSKIPKDQRNFSFEQFRTGKSNIMVSTKAFGMGVDISDIQVVYHHAPSGLLPDYVQEIGRAARKPNLQGIAAINYNEKDKAFSKALYGMSAIQHWQLQGILKKIYKTYEATKKQNMLISAEDFGFLFSEMDDINQKVLTSLMMIEKDYLLKYNFQVLIARPKKMFAIVYARMSDSNYNKFSGKYRHTIEHIRQRSNGDHIVKLHLDRLWHEEFSNISFARLKYMFFNKTMLANQGIEIHPQLRVSYNILHNYDQTLNILDEYFKIIKEAFISFGGTFFEEREFVEKINIKIKNRTLSKLLAEFILTSFSGRTVDLNRIEGDTFIQMRRSNDKYTYRVYNYSYLKRFANVKRMIANLFGDGNQKVTRFVSSERSNTNDYIRVGYLLEVLELGTFDMKGGDKDMIFLRVNDPDKIKNDGFRNSYKNIILSSTMDRHSLSNQIFDHFFMNSFTNEERWDFIEDFFLGAGVDDLLDKHKGGKVQNELDIIEFLQNNIQPIEAYEDESNKKAIENIDIYTPRKNEYYSNKNLLSLNIAGKMVTKNISRWLKDDPVTLHQSIVNHKILLDKELYRILMSRLENSHPDYFKKVAGLDIFIYHKGVRMKAAVLYNSKPDEFYKMWNKNRDKIYLSLANKIRLFNKLNLDFPNILLKKDLKFLAN